MKPQQTTKLYKLKEKEQRIRRILICALILYMCVVALCVYFNSSIVAWAQVLLIIIFFMVMFILQYLIDMWSSIRKELEDYREDLECEKDEVKVHNEK